MIFKILIIVSTAALFPIEARRRRHGGFFRRGRDGAGGMRRPFSAGIEEELQDFFQNITCPENVDLPTCSTGRGGAGFTNPSEGTWICRTTYHRITGEPTTFSDCIETSKSWETDSCGCCDGICPMACTCPCALRGDTTGNPSGVLVRRSNDDDEDNDGHCIPPEYSATLVSRSVGRVVCAECP